MRIFRHESLQPEQRTQKEIIQNGLRELLNILGDNVSINQAYTQLQLTMDVNPIRAWKLRQLDKKYPQLLNYLGRMNNNRGISHYWLKELLN